MAFVPEFSELTPEQKAREAAGLNPFTGLPLTPQQKATIKANQGAQTTPQPAGGQRAVQFADGSIGFESNGGETDTPAPYGQAPTSGPNPGPGTRISGSIGGPVDLYTPPNPDGPPPATLPQARPMDPTPAQQQAMHDTLANNPGQTAHWDGQKYVFTLAPGGSAAPANPTAAGLPVNGTSPVQADIMRRQSSTAPRPSFQGPTAITQPATPAASIPAGSTRGSGFTSPEALGIQPMGAPKPRPQDAITSRGPAIAAATGAKPAQSGVSTTVDQVRGALGPAPQIDMGLADRGNTTVQDALGLSHQVVDAALAPVNQTSLEQATADARSVLDRLLNGPNTADRIGSQTLRSQLAIARSAAGGPGAVQEALRNAQFAAPELEAQAAQQATAETLQRTQAAGNVAANLQSTALGQQQNETSRIQAASGAASGFAQGALGSRAQDIDIAKSNQTASTALINNISELTGATLSIDQKSQELIGQMFRDAAALDFDWAKLSVEDQNRAFDRYVQIYGIDTASATQLKTAMLQAAAGKKGVMDYAVPIIGAGATVLASTQQGNGGSNSSSNPSQGQPPPYDSTNEDEFFRNGGV